MYKELTDAQKKLVKEAAIKLEARGNYSNKEPDGFVVRLYKCKGRDIL